MKVSVFEKFTRIVCNLSINEVLDRIRDGYYREYVTYLRTILDQGNKKKYNEYKKKLQAFTPSAIYNGGRKEENFSEYSGIMCIDYDSISPDKLKGFINMIIALPYTYACFVSPSNRGLKVLVLTSSTVETHKTVYAQLLEYYQSELGIKADQQCNDVTRLCFMSWDPNLYLSTQSSIFPSSGMSESESLPTQNSTTKKMDDTDARTFYIKEMTVCINDTEKKVNFEEGDRNNFIYRVACKCNRKGVPEFLVRELLCAKYDLDKKEILASIKSAYTNHSAEFAKYAKHANSLTNKSKENAKNNSALEKAPLEDLKDSLKETPTIPD
ncbi:hypothetical protein HXX01_05070, partial [Candidatus Nomurabacteria bacterium]|nr:hypothetical protein [Candidatus Nomurabacteria bacterium]